MRSFDVFFDLRLNKRVGNKHGAVDLRRHRAQYDVTVMIIQISLIEYHGCWFVLWFTDVYLTQCWSTGIGPNPVNHSGFRENNLVLCHPGRPMTATLALMDFPSLTTIYVLSLSWYVVVVAHVVWSMFQMYCDCLLFFCFWKTNDSRLLISYSLISFFFLFVCFFMSKYNAQMWDFSVEELLDT